MSTRTRAGSVSLVLAILALFGSLILLVSSLDELTFRPGVRLAQLEIPDEPSSAAPRSTAPLTLQDKIIVGVLGGLTVGSIVCVFIFRKLRRQLLQYLFTLFAFVLPLMVGLLLFGRLFFGWIQRQGGEVAETGPQIPESVLSNPPTWSLALAAGAVAVLVSGVVAFIAARLLAFRESTREKRAENSERIAEQRELAQQAGETADRIREGRPLEGEVIRCYAEMDRLLSRRRRIRPTYLTPREFVGALRDLGIQSEHIRQLTELFELVRYGRRADEPVSRQALACLDRLRAVYGSSEDAEDATD